MTESFERNVLSGFRFLPLNFDSGGFGAGGLRPGPGPGLRLGGWEAGRRAAGRLRSWEAGLAWNWAGISSHTFNEHSKLMNM